MQDRFDGTILCALLTMALGTVPAARTQIPGPASATPTGSTDSDPTESPATERVSAEPSGPPGEPEAAPAPARPLDPADVEAFVDGYMEAYLAESGAVGGVVSIVHDGRVIFLEGYGYADRAKEREIDPARTLFRIGSVSKLFVWTAVMQLVEAGKLDLETDVNGYLERVEIPTTYPQPVTLRHLMTHTAGFEDHVLGLFAKSSEAVRPLDAVLTDQMPSRVRPPGDLASYSNHGTALAMLAIEDVAGVPWLEYLERRILEPLGMDHTTFRQPVPGELAADLSVGYSLRQDQPVEETFEFIPLAPVGAASATAADMARFMMAHLARGRLGDARILEDDTARRMQAPLHRHAPGIAGMAHGWIEGERGGRRVIAHGGDTLWFHTHLEIYPAEKVGIFASFNTAEAVPQKLAAAFAERYFPAPERPQAASPEALPRAAPAGAHVGARIGLGRFAGSYRSLRYSHDDLTKIGALLSSVDVRDGGDGTLRLSIADDERWLPVEPLLFRHEDGKRAIAFREDRRGAITHLFLGDLPVFAFERVPALESATLHATLLAVAVGLFVATLAVAALGALARWRYGTPAARKRRRLPLLARSALGLACLVFVAFFAGLLAFGDPLQVVFGMTPALRALLALPMAGVVLASVCALCVPWVWRGGHGGITARIGYTLVVMALVAVSWQLAVWRLLALP